MKLLKNKFLLFLVLLAAAFFVSVSLGGEFLHKQLHHHTTQTDHDNCSLYQLTFQLFLFATFIAVVLLVLPLLVSSSWNKLLALINHYASFSSRAPPLL